VEDLAIKTPDQLAAAIAATPGDKVTPDYMRSRIAGHSFHRLDGTLIVCVITLDNGYTVTGQSACADPVNFSEEIGQRIAYDNAFNALWPLFGFLLSERRHNAAFEMARIARACHEVNRAYCASLGDHSQPAWEDAPEWQRTSAIKGVEFTLANPEAGPSASHESWLAEKAADGWKYGPVKNPETKEHPCFVPYDELPVEQKAKDYLFQAVVRSMAK
jgi:hypothetical protein